MFFYYISKKKSTFFAFFCVFTGHQHKRPRLNFPHGFQTNFFKKMRQTREMLNISELKALKKGHVKLFSRVPDKFLPKNAPDQGHVKHV